MFAPLDAKPHYLQFTCCPIMFYTQLYCLNPQGRKDNRRAAPRQSHPFHPLYSHPKPRQHTCRQIMFGKNCSILCKFFGWIFSIAVTTPNIKSVNTYLLLRLPEKWTSFSLSPLPLILLFLIISILFSAELSSHLKALFDLLSEQYKMWNQDSRSLFSSNSSTALIVHRRLSSPS